MSDKEKKPLEEITDTEIANDENAVELSDNACQTDADNSLPLSEETGIEDESTSEKEVYEDEFSDDEFEDDEFIVDDSAEQEKSNTNETDFQTEEVNDNHKNIDEYKSDTKEKNNIIYLIAVALLKIHNTDRKKLVKTLSIWGCVLLLIIFILTDIIPVLPNSYHRRYVGNRYTLGETRNCDYDKFGENVLYIGGGAMCVFGPDMNLEYRKEIHTGLPVVSTNSNTAIVYFKNSSEYVVANKGDVKEHSIDGNICSAYISPDGFHSVATNTIAGHNASVKVYSPEGDSIYEWFTNYNVLDCVVSFSGTNMVASVVEVGENSVSAKLVFFDLTKSEPVSEVVLEDEIIFELYSTERGKIIAVGENETIAYTLNGKKIWQIDYNEKNLKTYDISDDGMLALVFDRYTSTQSESLLEVYDFNGKLNGTHISEKNIRRVSVNNSHALLTVEGGTVLLNNRCRVKEVKEINVNFDRAILFDNYNFGFIIHDGVSEIVSVCH